MRSARAEERARGCARGARVLTLGPTGGGFGGALGLSAFGAGFSALTATENLLRGTLRAAPARIIVVARICMVPKLLQAWLMGSVCWRVHVRTLLIHTPPSPHREGHRPIAFACSQNSDFKHSGHRGVTTLRRLGRLLPCRARTRVPRRRVTSDAPVCDS